MVFEAERRVVLGPQLRGMLSDGLGLIRLRVRTLSQSPRSVAGKCEAERDRANSAKASAGFGVGEPAAALLQSANVTLQARTRSVLGVLQGENAGEAT